MLILIWGPGNGGGIINKNLLLVMLLILGVTILNTTSIYALDNQTTNSTNTIQLTATSNTTINTTLKDDSLTTSSNHTDADTTNSSNYTDENTTNSLNSTGEKSTENSDTNTTENSAAAGGETSIHGVWISSDDASTISAEALKNLENKGITDIFVKANLISTPTYQTVLNHVLSLIQAEKMNLKVHAWISCFIDAKGNWIDPQGTSYTYTVKVPYEGWYQTWQQIWYKAWYKYKGHWTWKWASFWKLNWVWGQTTFDETRTGYNTSHNDEVVNAVSDIVKNYNVAGINLDYVRYPGTAYQHAGATDAITNFVKRVYNTVKSINSSVIVSADLMPEGPVNAHYYGQNYTQLAQYLDFMVPMIYKGNYGKDTTWIASTTDYIVSQANGTPVIAGLQTYKSDKDTTKLSSTELNNDINTAMNSGASGYALFRYGLIDGYNNPTDPSTPVVTQPTFTNDQILDASSRVKSYIESNKALPAYVDIGSTQVTMAQFLQLMVTDLLNINNGTTTDITLESVTAPSNPTDSTATGKIYKTEYLNLAQNIKNFIDSNKAAPNYVTSSLGKVQFESAVYMYSRILNFQLANKLLPNYSTMGSWPAIIDTMTGTGTPTESIPAELRPYLQSTANCQSTDSRITANVAVITNGATSTYDKAVKLYNWLKSNEHYQFYYNTQKGAVGTLCSGYGNCCDLSHLMVAFARAAGIPARYVHGYCKFSTAWYGHVWAELYVNNQWVRADLSSSRNSLGVINNWNTNTYTLKGYYKELPF
jgi:transglutaminase-like putative cysteine protease